MTFGDGQQGDGQTTFFGRVSHRHHQSFEVEGGGAHVKPVSTNPPQKLKTHWIWCTIFEEGPKFTITKNVILGTLGEPMPGLKDSKGPLSYTEGLPK